VAAAAVDLAVVTAGVVAAGVVAAGAVTAGPVVEDEVTAALATAGVIEGVTADATMAGVDTACIVKTGEAIVAAAGGFN